MKIITTTAAALFLFAATGIASAQSDGEGGSGSDGNNAGNSSGTNNNSASDGEGGSGNDGNNAAGNSGTNNNGASNGEVTGSTGGNVGGNDCTDYKPGTEFSQMSPKCREGLDSWAMGQTGSMKYDGDVAIGTTLPDTVTYVDVPTYSDYGYVMLNDRRVLVDRKNRTVVHVYEN